MSRRVIVVLFSFALAPPAAYAFDYSGRVMLGGFQQKEKLKEDSAGLSTNDRRDFLGRLFFDAANIGPARNQFTLDVRDRYAEYGRVDDERLVLVETNEPTLRQLSVRGPSESVPISWGLGRMPIPDAGTYGVDGINLGMRANPTFRIGLFGGLVPHRERGRSLEIDTESRQVGLYGTYLKRGRDWFDHAYITNALVAQETLEDPRVEQTTFDVPPIPQAIVSDSGEDDEQVPVNTIHWFHSGILQPNKDLRITSLAYLYLTPNVYLRNGLLTVTRQLTPKFSGSLALLRLDLTEYRRTRDVRERLAPSDYTQVKSDIKHKLNDRLVILGGLLYGKRGIDGLDKMQAQAGVAVSPLAGNRLATSFLGGYRKHFESNDTFIKISLTAYARRFEVDLDQQLIIEKRDDGETLHPSITGLSVGLVLIDSLMMSLGGEYAKDERATVSSALASISLRFGNRQLTPTRIKAPSPDRVGTEAL